ncbi:MarR family transcriptional regulator [uncultured Kordia sp.]|uniref:MarR family winged helix-turn-helix transcriptional regulator n=1 Tax=uncultured Kordia sp. TaxID=507699 RepID=UPI00260C1086|nr:MarR family transcriptional regulator [uncultured Kordia sp.]
MSEENLFKDEAKNWHARGYFKFLQVSGKVDVQLKKTLKEFGVTHSQLNVLNLLVKNHPNPLDAKTIKEKLIVPSPDLTRLLDRLVKKELVKRETCLDNRRKLDITVTDKGIELFYAAHSKAKKSVKNYFEDYISEEEARELFRILNKVQL